MLAVRQNTVMSAALTRAGVNTVAAQLFTNATQCLDEAGSFDVALSKFETRVRADRDLLRELCRSYLNDRASDMRGTKMGSAGRMPPAYAATRRVPDASLPNESDGQPTFADEAGAAVPSLSTERNGAGQLSSADKAKADVPGPVSPNPARGIGAIASVQPAIAKSIFKSTRLPDGRTLDQVQWHELPKLAAEYRQHSRVLMLLYRKVKPADTFLTVDQVVREQDVRDAIQQAETANDIF